MNAASMHMADLSVKPPLAGFLISKRDRRSCRLYKFRACSATMAAHIFDLQAVRVVGARLGASVSETSSSGEAKNGSRVEDRA